VIQSFGGEVIPLDSTDKLPSLRCEECGSGLYWMAEGRTKTGVVLMGAECPCGFVTTIISACDLATLPRLPVWEGPLGPGSGLVNWPRARKKEAG